MTSFSKAKRLRKSSDFQKLNTASTRYLGHWTAIEYLPNHSTETRLGITVTRRFGKSHERNRFKRIVREAFRLCYDSIKPGFDLNVKPRSRSKSATANEIVLDFHAFTKEIECS